MIVLIIEDEKEMTELWSRFLKNYASEIRIAQDPEQGLVLMQEPPYPDVVLLDLSFPTYGPKDTLTLVPRIKEIREDVTIVIITGNTEEKIMELSQKLGADYYARKTEHATSQNKLLSAIMNGLKSITSRQPSYLRPLEILEQLTIHTIRK